MAHERCLALLPDIKEKRKLVKGTPKVADHWRELHQESLTLLASLIPHAVDGTYVLATQLSNVLRQDLTHHSGLASIQDTRELCNKLDGATYIIQATLLQIPQHITTWAPDGQHQVLRLAAAYREMRNNNQGPASITLLFTIDHYPGCNEPRHLTDIWSHPIWGNKWADIVHKISFLQPPVTISAGRNAPMHIRKCLVRITLAHNSQNTQNLNHLALTFTMTPQLCTWQPTFDEVSSHNTIWIDGPHEHRWHIHSLIKDFKLRGLAHADRPRPNLGHRAETPRSVIHLHFDGNMGSELMQNLTTKWLNKHCNHTNR